jgi:membrane associated rhomboid family serine protease
VLFAIVNLAIIVANFWGCGSSIAPAPASVRVARLVQWCTVEGDCHRALPWAVSWFTSRSIRTWDHMLGNMLFLAIFGENVEDAFGRLRYLGFYIAGGVAATALQVAMTLLAGTEAAEAVPKLAASGAIAAVLGAYFVLYPNSRVLSPAPGSQLRYLTSILLVTPTTPVRLVTSSTAAWLSDSSLT